LKEDREKASALGAVAYLPKERGGVGNRVCAELGRRWQRRTWRSL